VRLVQSPNPGGLTTVSPDVSRTSPLRGMRTREAISVVNIHPPPGNDDRKGHTTPSQDAIGSLSEKFSGVDYERKAWTRRIAYFS
jgi:hypothetical protein